MPTFTFPRNRGLVWLFSAFVFFACLSEVRAAKAKGDFESEAQLAACRAFIASANNAKASNAAERVRKDLISALNRDIIMKPDITPAQLWILIGLCYAPDEGFDYEQLQARMKLLGMNANFVEEEGDLILSTDRMKVRGLYVKADSRSGKVNIRGEGLWQIENAFRFYSAVRERATAQRQAARRGAFDFMKRAKPSLAFPKIKHTGAVIMAELNPYHYTELRQLTEDLIYDGTVKMGTPTADEGIYEVTKTLAKGGKTKKFIERTAARPVGRPRTGDSLDDFINAHTTLVGEEALAQTIYFYQATEIMAEERP